MGRHTSNTKQPESTATLDESSKFWDGSVLKRAAWIKQLTKTLASDDANYRTLWEEGFVVEKGIAITQSVRHSFHLSINNIKKCVLTRPCPSNAFVRLDATIADAAVDAALATGFRIAPTSLKAHNRDLHDRILYYISNTKGAEDYEAQSNGDFITLIGLIVAEENDADAETGTWANMEKHRLVVAGLTTASIVGFDSFRLQFEGFNDMCHTGRHDPEAVVATIYTDVVKDLGDLIATKLEMKLEAASASGDLVKTVRIIRKLLGKMEGKPLGSARAARGAQELSDAAFDQQAVASARAAAGRDPIVGGDRRNDRNNDRTDYVPPVWTKGKHDLCDLCTRSDRMHLRKHCPDSATPGVDPRRQAERDKREKERSNRKQKKGSARVALGLTGSGTDSDSDSNSDCSHDSEQSVYDDEPEAGVQAADIALASIFDSGPHTVDVGQARVAHRLGRGDRAEQANAHMAAGRSIAAITPGPSATTTTLHSQSRAPAVPEAPLVAWAVGAASVAARVPAVPPTAAAPVTPSLRSIISDIILDDRAGCLTPLRRDDARRVIDSLDPRSSPLSMMQCVARAAELSEVRLGCGPPSAGSTENRTKAHVLADMRRAVGLDPTAVPMGIPMQTEGGEESAQAPAPPMPPPVPPPVPPPAPAWQQGTMASRRAAAGCTCEDDCASLELCSTCHAAWWCTGCFAAQCPCVMEDVRRLHAAADAQSPPVPVQPAPAAPAVQQATAPSSRPLRTTWLRGAGGRRDRRLADRGRSARRPRHLPLCATHGWGHPARHMPNLWACSHHRHPTARLRLPRH